MPQLTDARFALLARREPAFASVLRSSSPNVSMTGAMRKDVNDPWDSSFIRVRSVLDSEPSGICAYTV